MAASRSGSGGIDIQGWSIRTLKLPILNGPESDAAAATLHLPLPEICFGNNRLTIENKALGLKLEWDALSALRAVSRDTKVKVAHAGEWARGQAASSSSDVSVQKPFDWTYTTLHPGTINASSSTTSSIPSFEPAPKDHPGIPLHLLARQDIPILFFGEVPLFEDELGDNGIADVTVRVRVNSTSVFVLQRSFLRVDGVLFRIFDVRLYHAFGSSEIIRELKGREAKYEDVKAKLPADRRDDLKPLTDINWVYGVLEELAVNRTHVDSLAKLHLEQGGAVATEGEETRWEGLGTTLEVLKLSGA